MSHLTRVGSAAVALGLVGLWGASASAQMQCPGNCGMTCNTVTTCTYVPAAYEGSAGDVAVIQENLAAPTQSQTWLNSILGPLDPQLNVHAKLLYDSTGSNFTETFPDGTTPPTSHTTGEPHYCSRPISPYYLARLSPGSSGNTATGTYYEDAQANAQLVRSFGTPYCQVPADSYHINSFLNDDVPGGSCERLLVDYCNVP